MDEPSHSMESRREEFHAAFLESVDHGLLALGKVARQIIYDHIERNYHVKSEQIPDRLEVVHKALEGLLGAGASVVEKLIIKDLYQRLGLKYEDRRCGFSEHVPLVKEVYSTSDSKKKGDT